jgi:hypothetical protein
MDSWPFPGLSWLESRHGSAQTTALGQVHEIHEAPFSLHRQRCGRNAHPHFVTVLNACHNQALSMARLR